MTPPLLDPVEDLASVRDATEQLLEAVAKLDPAAVAEPSLLAGWTRGHVLAHVSRNADSLVNLITWARTGQETPQYPSQEARDRDIEDSAGHTLAAHLDDLRTSALRFAEAAEALPPQAWAAQVSLRSGRVVATAELPWLRLVEVLLHHVDLGIGFTCEHLPDDFATRELEFVVDGLSGHEGVAAVRLRDTEKGVQWDLGAAEEPEVTVSGPTHALLAWVSGRSTGEGLEAQPEGRLPTLPPLG